MKKSLHEKKKNIITVKVGIKETYRKIMKRNKRLKKWKRRCFKREKEKKSLYEKKENITTEKVVKKKLTEKY